MSYRTEETEDYFLHPGSGMVISRIKRFQKISEKRSFDQWRVVVQGFKGQAWVNKFLVGDIVPHLTTQNIDKSPYMKKVDKPC